MPEEKKLPPDVTIKLKIKIPRETYDRIVENAKKCGTTQNFEKGLEENAIEWIEYIDGFLQGQADSGGKLRPTIYGPTGEPFGRG